MHSLCNMWSSMAIVLLAAVAQCQDADPLVEELEQFSPAKRAMSFTSGWAKVGSKTSKRVTPLSEKSTSAETRDDIRAGLGEGAKAIKLM